MLIMVKNRSENKNNIPRKYLDQARVLHGYNQKLREIIKNSNSQILKHFQSEADKLAVSQYCMNKLGNAGACSMSYDNSIFKVEILYDVNSVPSFNDWVGIYFHEMIHAFQFVNADNPVLHLHPANQTATVWLHPLDQVFSRTCLEMDAFAKQGWLLNEFTKAAQTQIQSNDKFFCDKFNAAMTETKNDIHSALIKNVAASFFEDQLENNGPHKGTTSLRHVYQKTMIEAYVQVYQSLQDAGFNRDEIDFVRIKGQDIIDVTSSLGVCPLQKRISGDFIAIHNDDMDADLRTRLNGLLDRMDLPHDPNTLPSLREYRKHKGIAPHVVVPS